jgi:hypothetical protein
MTRVKRISARAIDYHRNGIAGAPFHAVLFDEDKRAHPDDQGRKVAIVFEQPWHTAVLDIARLAGGDIAFGSNSWRGDEYEPHLRRAIGRQATAERRALLTDAGTTGEQP